MQEVPFEMPPRGTESGASDSIRLQILATEHWSLLATRSMTWNEMFTRAGMFLSLLSATVVALALVAQATNFGAKFHLFALLLLPVSLVLGIGTQIRLGDARGEDVWLVIGMNRLRHAYLQMAPDLEPYFVTGFHDDEAGAAATYGSGMRPAPSRMLASTPVMVMVINAVVSGVIAALAAQWIGLNAYAYVVIGVAAGVLFVALSGRVAVRGIADLKRAWVPRFPTPPV